MTFLPSIYAEVVIGLQHDVYRVTENVGVVSVCAELLSGSLSTDAVVVFSTHQDDPVTAEALSKFCCALKF